MPKLNETWTRFKGSILVVLGALAALVAVITTTDIDDKLCAKWESCNDAYTRGQAGNLPAAEPSPTLVE